eukprot:421240-Amphidinium_carterae.1
MAQRLMHVPLTIILGVASADLEHPGSHTYRHVLQCPEHMGTAESLGSKQAFDRLGLGCKLDCFFEPQFKSLDNVMARRRHFKQRLPPFKASAWSYGG